MNETSTMSDEELSEMRERVRAMMDQLPQPKPVMRLAAFMDLAVEASGLGWRDGVSALLVYVRTVMQAPEARIVLRDDEADGEWWNAEDGRGRH